MIDADAKLSATIQDIITTHADASDQVLASALVRAAGNYATALREQGVETELKTSASDVVTAADRAGERLIAEVLGRLRPEDGITGEEGTAKASANGRRWIIDPVDGTYNFTSQSSYWCSALALVDKNSKSDVEFGAVYRPATDELFIGGPTTQTTRNGKDLSPIGNEPAEKLCIGTYLHPTSLLNDATRDAWIAVVGEFATLRMLGAGSVDLSYVASGKLGAWMQHSVADWDWLPGKAIIEGAGGATRKASGGGVEWCVAGNEQVVALICDKLSRHP